MRAELLNQLNSLIASNERLIELYRAMYYLLPGNETKLSGRILWLLEKREKLEFKLKKYSFYVRNSIEEKQFKTGTLFQFMPILLRLEQLVRLKFKGTRHNLVYLEERQYLKKYLELLTKENLPDSLFKLLLGYKRKLKSNY